MATCPCMKDAEHSYQLKLTTPGGPYCRKSFVYISRAATCSLLSSTALPSFRYVPPIGNMMLGYWVALAFLSPRSTMPYVVGGAWSFCTSGSRSASVLAGVSPLG